MNPRRELCVSRRAALEIRTAATWWQENRTAAAGAFGEELERAFELIALYPNVGSPASNTQLAGVRRVYVERIHYHVYYRSRGGRVEVLALWHASRGAEPPV